MRVLHVLEPPDGGVARHVRDLVGGQIERGHDVQAIVSVRGPLAADLRSLGAGVIAIDLRPEITAVASDLRFAVQMARQARRGRWAVVHTHGNKAGAIARPVAATTGLAVVVHTSHSLAFSSQEHRPRRGQPARRRLTLEIERWATRFARVIICVSEAERAEALAAGVGSPERLVVVPNGVPVAPEAWPDPRLVPCRDGIPLIGFLARLHPQKAPLLLLEALARLRARGVPFRAALVGDGPETGAVLERVVAERLGDVVTVVPFDGQVWPALAAFDIYVLPSLWESMPYSVLEAMAAGLPVVAADTGGVREAVRDGETGLLHPPGDVGALADALERLLGDAQLRARMGAAGRKRQASGYSLEAMIAGTEAAYARALAA